MSNGLSNLWELSVFLTLRNKISEWHNRNYRPISFQHMAHIIFAKFGTFVMTNDIDIYPHWYQFKYRDMRQTKWAFELKRLGKFLHLLFLKPINFKILELSIKYIKKVWYKFRNRTKRNTTFIVVIKADSRKKNKWSFRIYSAMLRGGMYHLQELCLNMYL